jgi:hypothetical protein
VSCAQVDVLLDLLRTHEPGEITILTIGMKPLEPANQTVTEHDTRGSLPDAPMMMQAR